LAHGRAASRALQERVKIQGTLEITKPAPSTHSLYGSKYAWGSN
jgi:hypothetical protein